MKKAHLSSSPVMLLPDIHRRSADISILLARLNQYSREMRKLDSQSNTRLLVIGSTDHFQAENISLSDFESLTVEIVDGTFGWLKFNYYAWSILRKRGAVPSILIAGDPWFGFLSCVFLKFCHKFSPRIQVQVHGDLYKFSKSKSFSEFLKVIFFNLEILTADSIRCVSDHQKSDLRKRFHFQKDKIFVAPIPINEIYYSAGLNGDRKLIGFVGRLHPERGIVQMTELILSMLDHFPKYEIHIVGDGPSRTEMEATFREIEGAKVYFHGWLQPAELVSIFEKMEVMVSTAPSEGYGMALRESLVCGVPVVARNSPGVLQAALDFPGEIGVFESVDEAISEIRKSMSKPISSNRVNEIRTFQREIDDFHVQSLSESWIFEQR